MFESEEDKKKKQGHHDIDESVALSVEACFDGRLGRNFCCIVGGFSIKSIEKH